jgi:K+-transporting ATPase KdpF subunit
MTENDVIGLVIAALLLGYLICALVWPERF